MYEHTYDEVISVREIFQEQPNRVLFWLLGRNIYGFSKDETEKFHWIAGYLIYVIYHKTLKNNSTMNIKHRPK